MKRSPVHSVKERLNQYLKMNGLRQSPIRDFVLEQACQLPQPFTAEQLEKACTEQHISTGTIYNALSLFVSAQILCVIKRQRGQSHMEYELLNTNPAQMQYICGKCGRVVEFKDTVIARQVKERSYSNFDMQYFSLIVYGECKKCRKATHKTKEQ